MAKLQDKQTLDLLLIHAGKLPVRLRCICVCEKRGGATTRFQATVGNLADGKVSPTFICVKHQDWRVGVACVCVCVFA